MQKISDVVRAAKITVIVTSALLMCGGVFIAFWHDRNPEVVRYLVGIICILMGATRMFGYFSNDLYKLAFQTGCAEGAVGIVIGVLFLLSPIGIFSVFPFIVGLYVLLDGMLQLQTALDARGFGMNHWRVLLVTAAAVILLGAVTLVLSTYGVAPSPLLGFSLFSVGADTMWQTMYTVRVRTKKRMALAELPPEIEEFSSEKDKK